jgi:hypothetical protein
MNERIQELVYKLNNQVGVQWTNEDKLKVAELIVQDCIENLDFHGHDAAIAQLRWHATNKYGVKL